MIYGHIREGAFICRPNRFIAHVSLEGRETVVHVKNTGRCRELLLPGVRVVLARSFNPVRKTAYDLTGVYKNGRLFNIDSQAPNRVVREWLEGQGFDEIRPEFGYGESRMDFFMKRDGESFLLEVKGCTLEEDGIGYFPDAPTLRGVRHLHELARASREGYRAYLAFVIQTEGVSRVLPNDRTHPAFGRALREAEAAGVGILYLKCGVTQESLRILPGQDLPAEGRG